MSELWIVVPNWEKFQHYRDRQPTWIKLYTELANRDDWCRLTLAARGLLVTIWIEYAATNGQLRVNDPKTLVRSSSRRSHFDSLLQAGFLRVSASKPLAIRARARERVKTETEREAFLEASLSTDRSEEAAPAPPPTHEATSAAPALCPQCGLECKSEGRLVEHIENVHWEDPPRPELVAEELAGWVRAAIKESR